jgi:transposase
VVGVEQWAEVRRLRFVRGLSIREISRRTGLHRETIRRAITSDEAPKYSRGGRGSKVDPFKAEIARLLGETAICRGCGSASCGRRWVGWRQDDP